MCVRKLGYTTKQTDSLIVNQKVVFNNGFFRACFLRSNDRNFSRLFFTRNWEKIIISPWRGRVGLSMEAYIIIPITPSPCCPMPTSCPEAIFGKIASISVKNRFWPKWDITSMRLKIGPGVFFEVLLTPTCRGFNVGNFWANINFRQFLAILAFLRKSPNLAPTPPLYTWSAFAKGEIEPGHLGTPYLWGRCQT